MNYESFVKDAAHKRRSVKDLARFIATRTDNNPNYSLLFGAGCSISSGVRSANQLATLWRSELYSSCSDKPANSATPEEQRTYLKANEGSWYFPDREYSSLFEKRYDLQRQRRMFVEAEVAGKTPSIGYAYLTSLVSQNYFNTIFTTNFDDILNEAFYVYSSQRPIVCAHDSSINSITVTSKRPKVIKIHGDYLFDDLKSTVRETENLEQNIKAKFMEFAKDYGLIVVGYSGGDRSVMDVLASLLRNEEFLKNGIYWCLRPNSEVSEELRKLIWRDRVYFVEVSGFDELFAELFNIFNDGQILPDSATSIIHRPSDTTTKLLNSPTAFPTTSLILKQAREKLERQSKRTNLVNLIVRPDNDDAKRQFSNEGLEDDELVLLAEIQNLALSGSHERAIELGKSHLRQSISTKLRSRILRAVADEYEELKQNSDALRTIDELIAIQPRKASHYLLKASFQTRRADKLKSIELAIGIDPYSVGAQLESARYYVDQANHQYGEPRVNFLKQAHVALDRGIELDPAWTNNCWLEKFNLLRERELDKTIQSRGMVAIVDQLKKQNPFSYRVLNMRQTLLESGAWTGAYDELSKDIGDARERYSPDMDLAFDRIALKLIKKSNDDSKLRGALDAAILSEETIKDSDYTIEIARTLREKFERDEEAIDLLKKSLAYEFDSGVLNNIVKILAYGGKDAEAVALLDKWTKHLSPATLSELRAHIFEMRGDFELALSEVLKRKADMGLDYIQHEYYLRLCKHQYKEVEESLRSRLETFNFTPEASVDTVNYELSKKKLGHKVNTERLHAVMKLNAANSRLLAAAYAVLSRKNEMLAEIRKCLKEDRTFRFQARRWPAFDEYRTDHEFLKITAET
ncbi:SIR2-like domain-containing protein [Polaromonas sp. YR568]|uniref:SIR2 family protein n=1 Tax=Polaromonas sp. YR568 TaxID=1855301 RepID=UPI0008ECB252|nr:SIR2 family protein [Polaromonas sp. YR568]SFU33160.1 SIR2-like domain-containing protein [Polaromonas sp. YR568]